MSALQTTEGVNTRARTSQARSSVAVTLGTSWMKTEGAASVSACSELPQAGLWVPPVPPVQAWSFLALQLGPFSSFTSSEQWQCLSPALRAFPVLFSLTEKGREFWHSYTSSVQPAVVAPVKHRATAPSTATSLYSFSL